MLHLGLEITDEGIRATGITEDAQIISLNADAGGLLSPAWVIKEGKAWVAGNAARQRSRAEASIAGSNFWEDLSTGTTHGKKLRATKAELAKAHLRAVVERLGLPSGSLYLALPGYLTSKQLGLILGFVEEMELPLAGMVDLALASLFPAAPLLEDAREIFFADLTPHTLSVTPIRSEEELRRGQPDTRSSTNFTALENRLMTFLAEEIVREARFDPLHDAASSQRLYDQLPGLLEQFSEQEFASVKLPETGGVQIERARVDKHLANWREKATGFIKAQLMEAKAPKSLALVVSERLAQVPGMSRELTELAPRTFVVPAGAGSRGAALLAFLLADEDWEPDRFVTELDRTLLESEENDSPGSNLPFPPQLEAEKPMDRASAASKSGPPIPFPVPSVSVTHLIFDGVAYAIPVSTPFVIGRKFPEDAPGIQLPDTCEGVSRRHCEINRTTEGEVTVTDLSQYGTAINDVKVQGPKIVRAGDLLSLADGAVDLMFVHVQT